MKKKIASIAIILSMLSITAIGTLAYFNDSEITHNIITTGDVNIVLEEWKELPSEENKDGVLFEDVIGVMPGQSVDKIVRVHNKAGSSEAWVRMWVIVAISDDRKQICLPLEVNGVPIAAMDYDTVNWEQGTDGYWYYKKALKAGETTEALFTKVNFAAETPNQYQETRVIIDVMAEAVQAVNNGSSAMTAEGWPDEGGSNE